MKRKLFAGLAAAGAVVALAAPASAVADDASAVPCDKPTVKCVNEILFWLVTYDPCLMCESATSATRDY